jgi:hypothetical protein
MQPFRIALVSAAGAILLAAAAFAQPAPRTSPQTTAGESQMQMPEQRTRRARGGRIPRELKVLWKQEVRKQLKAMPREQRHAWFKQQWQSMSEQQRQAKIAELQAKWNALPQSVRQATLEKMQSHAQAHRAKGSMTDDAASPND